MNVRPTVRVFAPEQWGELHRFAQFHGNTFSFKSQEHRAVSGAGNHFNKAVVLYHLVLRLQPTLQIDVNELEANGYTPADNSRQLSAVVEGVFTELYSSIDCTRAVIYAVYGKCRGVPNSTRKLFQRVKRNEVGDDFPNALKEAIINADWYEELLHIRDELTHCDVGTCHLFKDTSLIQYMHTGLKKSGSVLIVDDIVGKLSELINSVNSFLDRVFRHFNSLLSTEPIPVLCGIFHGRGYMRSVIPAETTDFDSGTCISTWFELPENPSCPFASSCGAYKRAKEASSNAAAGACAQSL